MTRCSEDMRSMMPQLHADAGRECLQIIWRLKDSMSLVSATVQLLGTPVFSIGNIYMKNPIKLQLRA